MYNIYYPQEKHLQKIQPGSGGYQDLPNDAEEKDEPLNIIL